MADARAVGPAPRQRQGAGLPPAGGGQRVPFGAPAPGRGRPAPARHRLPAARAAPDADTGALEAARRSAVLDALARLPDRQREVLVLRHYLDLSEAEIADALGIARGSVKSHASRGAAALRELLGRPLEGRVVTDHELRELLTDAVADIEPRYALDDIRARTSTGRRRWPYAAAGAVLAVAATITAFAVLGPDPPRATVRGRPAPPSPSTRSRPPPLPPAPATVAVYFVGDTPDGPRLYREFRRSSPAPTRPSTGRSRGRRRHGLAPRPGLPHALARGRTGVGAGTSSTTSSGSARPDRDPDPRTPRAEGRAAIEQLIYTAQAAVQERLPVQFLVNGNPSATILGLPTSEPLANAPVLDTLALVSLTTPTEGMLVDNDEPLVVEGVGNSFEGTIVTRVQRWEGTSSWARSPRSPAGADKLFPFEVALDLTGVPPGDYVVISPDRRPIGRAAASTPTRGGSRSWTEPSTCVEGEGEPQRAVRARRALTAARPAVDVRRTSAPRRTVTAPAASKAASSSGVIPPSGPTTTTISPVERHVERRQRPRSASSWSTATRCGGGDAVDDVARSTRAAVTVGGHARGTACRPRGRWPATWRATSQPVRPSTPRPTGTRPTARWCRRRSRSAPRRQARHGRPSAGPGPR